MPRGRRTQHGLGALLASAALPVLVAVLSDLAADEAPLHVVTLGAIIAIISVSRVLLAGRDRGLLQLMSGCILVQPVLHAAVKLLPHGPLDHGADSGVGHADLFVSGTQVVIALAVVGSVVFLEQLLATMSTVVRVCWIPTRPAVPDEARSRPVLRRTPVRAQLSSRYRPVAWRKRGPPRAVVALT